MIKIDDGVYQWNIDKAKKGFSWFGGRNSGRIIYTDFDLYVDARRIQGTAADICYGLRFRESVTRQEDNAYVFEVCDNGYFQVDYYDGKTKTWSTLKDWTWSDAILADEWNKVGVSARGPHFTFSINDWTVADLEDARLKNGKVAVFIEAEEGETGKIWFDNFAIQPR